MEDYVQAAIARGLRRLVFLEHLETGIDVAYRSWLTDKDFDAYFAEGQGLRQRYRGRIDIGLGVEVGYNPERSDEIITRLERRTWDRIGLSCHFFKIPDYHRHLNVLSKNQRSIDIIEEYGDRKLLSAYFATLIEAVQTIPADVLCHLDAGLRHQPNLFLEDHHWQQIEALLAEVKKAGMMLEINTSGYHYRGQPFPLPDIINMARKIDIPLSLGSDAHSPSEVGRYFDRVADLLA